MASSDWRSLYPFESHELKLDRLRYHYVDEGGGDPLLMVHGNPTWSFYWRNLILAFRDDHRTIAPDHIGCGLSDKPESYSYTLTQHIDNLVRLIQKLDLANITLLAHDWGGAIGLGAALELPERFSRIVLFNTAAFPPPFIPLRIRACRIPIFGRIAVRGFNAFARAATTMATEKGLAKAVKCGLLAPYNNWATRIATHQFVRDIPTSPKHPTWQKLAAIEAGLPSLADRPVQMIWGMKDWCFTPECLERLLESFPNAEVHRLEDAGHYVIEDADQQIVPLVAQFLQSSSADMPAASQESNS